MATMSLSYHPHTSARPGVRLTRRGRAVVRLALGLMIAFVAYLLLSLGTGVVAQALSREPAALVTHTVVVQPGDTLWSIAARELPGTDPREGILRLRTLNALAPADSLIAGRELLVPGA